MHETAAWHRILRKIQKKAKETTQDGRARVLSNQPKTMMNKS
jgi:hypothetical protein